MGETARVYVGTAGFSYRDWRGPFYPETMKPAEFLGYYKEKFPCVEIDFTYYRQPAPKTMESMAKRVGPDFRFTVKAHRTITHEIPEGSGIDRRSPRSPKDRADVRCRRARLYPLPIPLVVQIRQEEPRFRQLAEAPPAYGSCRC